MAQAKSADPGLRTRRFIAAAAAGILLLAGAFAAGRITGPQVGTPDTTSAEAGFARDMQVHHQQAVELSMTVRDLTTDDEVRRLAFDIALGQSQGAGQLYGYLVEWKLPQNSPEPSMTWMARPGLDGATHSHGAAGSPAHVPGSPMPGLATPAQVAKLATLHGVEAERFYLTLMIAHHQGGIEMAQALLDRSIYPSVVGFARAMISVQTSEIQTMKAMLAARS
ncbi:MAG: hypothetical protein JWQ12_1101 [Glaciihabitans sp.]|nr:hypothetical protein [Glaciihabitans sp.]